MRKRIGVSVLIVGMLLCTAACAKKTINDDVLTQKVSEKNKIEVTVLVKNAFSINAFETAAEEQFSNLDIIQVGNYTSDMGVAEYSARLEHDDLTDVVMTWPLDVGEEYWSDRLMDLSALPLSGKYTTAMLDNISQDGKLYYLPGPSQVRGIVYNKTMFEENGWKVPSDFDGFVNLCHTIEESGIRSLQLGLGNEEVLDTAFVGYGYGNCFSTPEDAQWLSDYNAGKGNFGDQFSPALDTFQTLIDEGILKKEDLELTYSDRETMIFNRQCAMVEDSTLLTHLGDSRTGTTDEFGLMPFFNPGEDSDWARIYPVCYIGLSKHLAETENREKYDLILELLEYISTKEGQKALSGDTGAVFSSLNGMDAPDVPEVKDLIPALNEGRYAVFPTLENAQSALRKGLAGMVAGTMTAEEVCTMVDQENLAPPVDAPPKVLGTAEKDFTLVETGNFVTDTMRTESGCEIALFLDNGKDGRANGKGISGRLYEGDVTELDIKRLYPDVKAGETGEMWKVTMTGANLINTLENSILVDNNQSGWFYYFAGLKMEFAPAAKAGKRIQKITDEKGKDIDPKQIYSIAVMDGSIKDEYMLSCEKTGILIPELLASKIQSAKTIAPSEDGRFTVCEP